MSGWFIAAVGYECLDGERDRERARTARLALVRSLFGLSLIAAPGRVLAACGAPSEERAPIVITRILGVRHLLEAAVLWIAPSRPVALAGAGVDATHAATAAAFAAAAPRWRRAALINLATACALALATTFEARR